MAAPTAHNTFLSVVIPTYNESGRIANTVEQIAHYLDERGLSAEILVVDDGSRDDTVKEAQNSRHGRAVLRVLPNALNRGKGFAIKCGVREATGQVVLFTDVDLAVPPREFDKFLPAISRGADVVIGSRRLGGSPLRRWIPGLNYSSSIKVHQPLRRELLGEVYQSFVRLFLGLNVKDTNCGFKCFRADVAKRIFAQMTVERWGFDAEILLLAKRYGCRVEELEVEWHDGGTSKVNMFTAPFSSLAEVFRIKANDLRGAYRDNGGKNG